MQGSFCNPSIPQLNYCQLLLNHALLKLNAILANLDKYAKSAIATYQVIFGKCILKAMDVKLLSTSACAQ